jgi:hypothetical protein
LAAARLASSASAAAWARFILSSLLSAINSSFFFVLAILSWRVSKVSANYLIVSSRILNVD